MWTDLRQEVIRKRRGRWIGQQQWEDKGFGMDVGVRERGVGTTPTAASSFLSLLQ